MGLGLGPHRSRRCALGKPPARVKTFPSFKLKSPPRAVQTGDDAMAKLFPTTLVGSYPQPDWLIDRKKLAGRFPPRVRATELWRVSPDWLERGAGRRDAARHPRPGARRARHHHRRRDAPRELLQPLRHGARGRRHRQSRHRARPQRPSEPGAARRRQDPAEARGRGARPRVPQGEHRRAWSR